MIPDLRGIIKRRYPVLRGRDWIKSLDSDDRDAFLDQVRAAGRYGVMGGVARSSRAKRDSRGRFAADT